MQFKSFFKTIKQICFYSDWFKNLSASDSGSKNFLPALIKDLHFKQTFGTFGACHGKHYITFSYVI